MDNNTNKDEPRNRYSQSVESEFAIEHPLITKQIQKPTNFRALSLFSESVMYLQDGNISKASTYYHEALEADANLHKHACEDLQEMTKGSDLEDEGPIYYWLGIHTQYLEDYVQAGKWYQKAVESFHNIGYTKREGRARCNLGRIKMKYGDPSALEEFEKAIVLNPMDGIAHFDIGTAYFLTDEHERALDAFADAVWADPGRYDPIVISFLQNFGYTWKEDVEKIGQRIAKKQGMDLNTLTNDEREDILQANHYFEIGYRFFRSCRYKDALEQYEKGKLHSKKFPGNFMGVSMTAMQMIEEGVIPLDQIADYLEIAEKNIDQCLRIAPTHTDYQTAKNIIQDYKKKYHM